MGPALIILLGVFGYTLFGALVAGVGRRFTDDPYEYDEQAFIIVLLWPGFFVSVPMMALYRLVAGKKVL